MHSLIDTYFTRDSTSLIAAVLAGAAAMVLLRGLRRMIQRLGASGHLRPTMALRLHMGLRWAVLTLALMAVLQATGLFDNAWAMLSAVLATVAIGFFAVWSLLSNTTGALLILTFRPFHHGDRVELVEPTNGTALGGTVTDINLMYTTLEHIDPETGVVALLQIPNNLFFQKVVRTHPAASPHAATPFFRDSLAGAPDPERS